MTLKVGHGQNSSPAVTGNKTSGHSNSHGQTNHSENRGDRTYAHDNTPTRQRELETHGNNQRTKVHGQSRDHGDQHHSDHSSFVRSEHGVGGRFKGHNIGAEIEAGVGNKTHGSQHQRGQFDGRQGFQGDHNGHHSRTDGSVNPQHHFRGDFDGRSGFQGDHNGQHSRSDGSINSQHHFRGDFDGRSGHHDRDGGRSVNHQNNFRGQFNTHDDRGRTGNHHDSEGFRSGVQRGNEHRWSPESSERSNNGRHDLRESLRTLRNDLNIFRSDRRDGPRQSISFTDRQIDRVVHLASRGLDDRFNQGDHSRRVLSDASGVVRVAEHFSRLESTGGEPVRRAYETVLNFLLNDREPQSNRLRLVTDILGDLRRGAFLNARDMEGPFPLTGRARVVSEMMALMRTIEAIEKFAAEMKANPNGRFPTDLPFLTRGAFNGVFAGDVVELLAQVLADSSPNFPGLAGRLEIPRLIAALDGVLTDSAGRPLFTADGTPLKLGELLWFNVRPDSAPDGWTLDRFSTRFSPVIVNGFDAVYSLIGFDGRQLSLPRFVAIQSQINASEFEWLFGQAPLSEGWIRSAIEYLKDSISVDNNVLGELLEEAVTSGRFHLSVMRGTVDEGRPVAGSFSFTPVLLNPAFTSPGR